MARFTVTDVFHPTTKFRIYSYCAYMGQRLRLRRNGFMHRHPVLQTLWVGVRLVRFYIYCHYKLDVRDPVTLRHAFHLARY